VKNLALLFLAAACVCCSADKIDDLVRAEMKRQNTPAVSIAVIRHGKLEKTAGYGFANLETKTAATADTVYEIGSITKQFTAALIMTLVEANQLKLDDPITQILPQLPSEWSGITVRHLLTHTSGLPDYTEAFDFEQLARNDYTFQQILDVMKTKPMKAKTGEKFEYCNFGYYLLGRIIEKACGKSYWDYLSEKITKPLGMNHTCASEPHKIIENRARGYVLHGKTFENRDPITSSSGFSAGSIVSTVKDMAKWQMALGRSSILSKTSWTQMLTPGTTNDGKPTIYSFGLVITKVNGHTAYMHSGGTVAFVTHAVCFPDDDLSVVVLTNSNNSNPNRISRIIAGEYVKPLGLPEEKPIEDKEPNVTALFRKAIEDIAAKRADPNMYTEEMRKALFPDLIKNAGEQFSSLGAIKKITLIGKETKGALRTYKYKVEFASASLDFSITLTPDGKIAGLLAGSARP